MTTVTCDAGDCDGPAVVRLKVGDDAGECRCQDCFVLPST